MRTDEIQVSASGQGMEAALDQVEKLADYKQLSHKGRLHLRLLTEETMGMMRSLTGAQTGSFWIEDEEKRGEFRLHLMVMTRMNSVKREQLLSTATSGKNESARGLMGRIRDFFEQGSDEDVLGYGSPLILPDMIDLSTNPALDLEWSMTRYESALTDRIEQDAPGAREAWDELEKSVVAHVADEIKVSIRGDRVEMIIIKAVA